jgi:multiple sugar transport system substrate-binding protein
MSTRHRSSILSARLSRRDLLRRGALVTAGTGLMPLLAACAREEAAAPGAPTTPQVGPSPAAGRTPTAGAQAVTLDFVVWSYSVETIQDNIKRFQEKYPGITVNLSDFSWNAYHETMVNRFQSKTPTDVAYNGEDWLPEFAAAGWVVPLEDYFDWVKGYQDKTFAFAWESMTYQGKVYGLPYYADTITFLYNEKVLQDAGITKPPETWEEVTEQAKALKQKGMEFPFIAEIAQDLANTTSAFASMVFGRGGDLFDEQGNLLLGDPASPAAQQFRWIVEARNKDKILTYVPHETDVIKAMNTGQHAFTVLYNYNLAELNNKARSPLAGQFKLALMPGETHQCYGFAKFYNMTQMAVDRGPDVIDACGKFIQYFGGEVDGEYHVAKRWAVEKGLGFGQKPLMDDPDVQQTFSQWIDVDLWKEQLEKAKALRQFVWYGIWSEFFRREYVRAIAGETSVEDALESVTRKWDELKRQYGG